MTDTHQRNTETTATVTEELEESVDDLSVTVKSLTQRFNETRHSVFARFPLLFTLLGAFGLVATYYGFENIIDQIPLFADNPSILLITGLCILIGTGQLYKKLG